eukprot:IDg7666t1
MNRKPNPRGGVFAGQKGGRMLNVKFLRPNDADLRRLMNYRYYRIPEPPNCNVLCHSTNYLRTLNAVKIYMSGCQFGALEPTLVYEFLDRFYFGCLGANRLSSRPVEAGRNRDGVLPSFVKLHTACSNYLRHSKLKSLFINCLDARLRNAVRSFMHANPHRDLGALLEAVERERSSFEASWGPPLSRISPQFLVANPPQFVKEQEVWLMLPNHPEA